MTGDPLHVVMTGFDCTVFVEEAPSDTRSRMLGYAQKLDQQRPGSRLTYLALGAPTDSRALRLGPLQLVPVPADGALAAPFRLYAALRRLRCAGPIDVITTQTPAEDGWAALVYGLPRRIPVVAQVHGDIFAPLRLTRDPLRRALRRARWMLTRVALPRYAALRVVGEEVAAALRGRGLPVAVIPVASVEHRPVEALTSETRRVLYVGRMTAEKRLDVWLSVARRVADRCTDVSFDLVGDGPLRADLERRARELGLASSCRFVGAVPHERLASHYASATVLLLTSDHEGFGRVLVEAGRAGLPVVATDVPGPRDIVIDGTTGYLRPRRDVAALADAVLTVLRDDDVAAAMRTAARAHVTAKFSADRLTDRWMELLVGVARRGAA